MHSTAVALIVGVSALVLVRPHLAALMQRHHRPVGLHPLAVVAHPKQQAQPALPVGDLDIGGARLVHVGRQAHPQNLARLARHAVSHRLQPELHQTVRRSRLPRRLGQRRCRIMRVINPVVTRRQIALAADREVHRRARHFEHDRLALPLEHLRIARARIERNLGQLHPEHRRQTIERVGMSRWISIV